MRDFGRTYCDLHPNELISNFCCKEQCLTGLCATCICTHTEMHIQKRTTPQYQNIRTTYAKIQDSMRLTIGGLQTSKMRINGICEIIAGKIKHVSEVVKSARQETIGFVNKYFDAAHQDIIRRIDADQKKLGLHNENRMDSLLNLISRDLSILFSSAQELSSQNFLESYQRIKTQTIENTIELNKEISLELDRNQNYETLVSLNPMYINDVNVGLQKCLSVIFNEKKGGKVGQNKTSNQQLWKQVISKISRIQYSEHATTNPSNLLAKTMKRNSQSHSLTNNSHIFQNNSTNVNNNQAINSQGRHSIQAPTRISGTVCPQSFIQFFSNPNPNQSQIDNQRHSNSVTYNSSINLHHPSAKLTRVQLRCNNREAIKDNAQKYFISPNFSENKQNQNSQVSVSMIGELIKKVRKSGLTVLKNMENESISSNQMN